MGLARTQRVAINREAKLDGVDLSPQEYFVLSRIEGEATVGNVLGECLVVGLCKLGRRGREEGLGAGMVAAVDGF